ncbi:Chromatin structure remodeling complex protein sfh1 [Nowakowskiella sp. JEL0407]|nr:Chromatin structure remodeling complex protein sfh1 [Nowakowskiella sp. JEL0407]
MLSQLDFNHEHLQQHQASQSQFNQLSQIPPTAPSQLPFPPSQFPSTTKHDSMKPVISAAPISSISYDTKFPSTPSNSGVMNIKSLLNNPGEIPGNSASNASPRITAVENPSQKNSIANAPTTALPTSSVTSRSDKESKKNDPLMITPRVFQCAKCFVIFGDSCAQVELDDELRLLALSAATTYVRVSDQLRMYNEGPFTNCAYFGLENFFTFDLGTIVSYRLGPVSSRLFSQTYDKAQLEALEELPPMPSDSDNYASPPPDQNAKEFPQPSNSYLTGKLLSNLSLFSGLDARIEEFSSGGTTKHRKTQPHRSLPDGVKDYHKEPHFVYSPSSEDLRASTLMFSPKGGERFKRTKKLDIAKPLPRKAPEALSARGSSKNKNWRCAWCLIPRSSTPTLRRGPEGPKTLCNACGLCFSKKGSLPADRQFWYSNGVSDTAPASEPKSESTKSSKRRSAGGDDSKKKASYWDSEEDHYGSENESEAESEISSTDETSAANNLMMLMQPNSSTPSEIEPEQESNVVAQLLSNIGGMIGATSNE